MVVCACTAGDRQGLGRRAAPAAGISVPGVDVQQPRNRPGGHPAAVRGEQGREDAR